ncbi:hypothetical protein M747DRAFT_142562 [Aspergillus niger ATCC 13496]|uniref:Uncharacterized protein n=1 Tax=Aspergillus niger ATCC 13496 TaxID=1353008 RepID=A0A370BI70_ASPNG|nr:hypothetical protein M747DRAFT_142562 [Aspergillus niger ATCC 13496]
MVLFCGKDECNNVIVKGTITQGDLYTIILAYYPYLVADRHKLACISLMYLISFYPGFPFTTSSA